MAETRRNRPIHVSLHVTLIGVFASVVILGFTITLGALWRDGQMEAAASAQSSFSDAAALARQRVADLLDEMLSLARVGAAMPGAAQATDRMEEGSANAVFLRRVIDADPAVYAAYIGRTDGSFQQAIALRGDEHVRAAIAAPEGTAIALRVIGAAQAPGAPRAEFWSFLDQAGHVLARRAVPQTGFDPRTRPWFTEALASNQNTLSAPYVFASTDRPGITAAQALPDGAGAFAVDLDLSTLNRFVDSLKVSPHGHAWLLDDQFNLLAGTPNAEGGMARFDIARGLAQNAEWNHATPAPGGAIAYATFWQSPNGRRLIVAVAAPQADFSYHVRQLLGRMVPITLGIMLATLLVTVIVSQLIAGRLKGLMRAVDAIRHLNFEAPLPARSMISELDLLGQAMGLMQQAIGRRTAELERAQAKLRTLVQLGIAMGAERDVQKLADMALEGAVHITGASAGTLYLRQDDEVLQDAHSPASVSLAERDHPIVRAVLSHRSVAENGALALPLRPLGGEVVGAMRLEATEPPPDIAEFIEALAASAAAALENRRLLGERDKLLDALISLVAGAIDAKSPYTGGHCRRVPELAVMLAEAAHAAEHGSFAAFRFDTEDEWREFRVAAWLHDCGKVATPEYVVDKATKLETLYNRLHEIRTRFEVLLRDSEIASLRARLAGEPEASAAARHAETAAALQEDFAFLASCNLGGEAMSDTDIARVLQISGRSWVRNFSDRIGLSMAEQGRLQHPPPPLPQEARLLEDRLDHIIPRDPAIFRQHDRLQLNIAIPHNQFDFGEIRNLCIRRGTLTDEERYIINEHVVHSIAMLESLPLPKELHRVPEYAGTHHETLDGTGYPRRLDASQLAVPSRIMAIADIFEALTASDRPYRPAKRLSEAVRILAGMAREGRIDEELFRLFLESGVCRRYVERFLRPDQIDLAEIAPDLRPA